jgi:hypothetical protein
MSDNSNIRPPVHWSTVARLRRDQAKAKSNLIYGVVLICPPVLGWLVGSIIGRAFDLEWTIGLSSAAVLGLANWIFWRCLPEADQHWDDPAAWDDPPADPSSSTPARPSESK